jgi:hypothetical protein
MRSIMSRIAFVAVAALICGVACDSKDDRKTTNKPDGGGTGGNASASSALERPGLPRAPGSGLPAELRPPR